MVVTNPPYVREGGGIINKHSSRATARLESTAGLSDFLRVAKDILRDKGDFYMVHRPSRLVDILAEGRSWRQRHCFLSLPAQKRRQI